jgi:hypothetical protein
MVLAAERAKLFHLETLGGRLFILHAGVILPLTLGALKCNLFARHIDNLNFFLSRRAPLRRKAP